MPEEDRELFESGLGRDGASEGAPPADLRLARGVHEGGADEPAQGVLADADPADDPVPSGDVCGRGFDFLSAPEDERETDREACVGNIRAFVRGGTPGLHRLRRVLPNIFRTFPDLPPSEVLVECGLTPLSSGGEFPTFLIHSDTPSPSRKRPRVEDDHHETLCRSQELLEAYEAARSSWESSPAPSSSNS